MCNSCKPTNINRILYEYFFLKIRWKPCTVISLSTSTNYSLSLLPCPFIWSFFQICCSMCTDCTLQCRSPTWGALKPSKGSHSPEKLSIILQNPKNFKKHLPLLWLLRRPCPWTLLLSLSCCGLPETPWNPCTCPSISHAVPQIKIFK